MQQLNSIESKIITIRNQQVIIDSDIAFLYGVETREINQAVKNNQDKFPKGYILELTKTEFADLRSKILISNAHAIRTLPKAFTERGLYMLATILKSPQATQTTIAIIDTFAKIRELSRSVALLAEAPPEPEQKSLMKRSSEIIADLLGNELKTSDTETCIELNLALVKFKHTVKKSNPDSKKTRPKKK